MKARSSRLTGSLAASLALVSLSCTPHGAGDPGRSEILWDRYGIPHILARSPRELFYGLGWAQMRNHGDLILRLYGQARGRAAEYWGEEYLDSDRWVLRMGIPARARSWYESQDASSRSFLDAFVHGVNDYLEHHADRIDSERLVAAPVHASDVLAHLQRSVHFTFVTSAGRLGGISERWRAGSNAWAVAPARSESGNAMLLANPHLPWRDLFVWMEAQLTSPQVNAYGAVLVGNAFLGIGFNDHLGWTHTVNTHDGADLYELILKGDGYEWQGSVEPFQVRRHTIKVKDEDGTLREEELTVRLSVHGPVIAEKGGRALALRVVGLESPHLMRQYWDMSRARNLEEFEAALRQMQMPMFTVMYADRDGRILHLFGGHTPVRPRGDWNWSGIVPGTGTGTLWTGIHGYEELPRVVDPASGWLQNANDPPWTTTFPVALKADGFPGYLAPRFMHFRAQRSARLLMEDERVSFQELIAYKHSTRMELADRLLDDLARAVGRSGSQAASRALAVLQDWDRSTDVNSRGAVLFQEFARKLLRGGRAFEKEWRQEKPRELPDGLRDPAAAVAVLERAFRAVGSRHGDASVPWGDVYRFRRDELDLPGNGGPGGLGIFRVIGYSEDDDGRFRATGGDSFIAALEFSDPVRARTLIAYGNASQPGSPHRTDQLELASRKQLRPVWRTRREIEENLSSRTEINLSP